jgi:hypothetical protein
MPVSHYRVTDCTVGGAALSLYDIILYRESTFKSRAEPEGEEDRHGRGRTATIVPRTCTTRALKHSL